jgi:hypothetical protein
VNRIGTDWPEKRQNIGRHLYADLLHFRRNTETVVDASHNINRNLIKSMPDILCSKYPALTAAQVEFDRTFRTIVKEKACLGKKIVFISGIHIDVSPREGRIFPLTRYVPWAAYIHMNPATAIHWNRIRCLKSLRNKAWKTRTRSTSPRQSAE